MFFSQLFPQTFCFCFSVKISPLWNAAEIYGKTDVFWYVNKRPVLFYESCELFSWWPPQVCRLWLYCPLARASHCATNCPPSCMDSGQRASPSWYHPSCPSWMTRYVWGLRCTLSLENNIQTQIVSEILSYLISVMFIFYYFISICCKAPWTMLDVELYREKKIIIIQVHRKLKSGKILIHLKL